MNGAELAGLAGSAAEIAAQCGRAILEIYGQDFEVESKAPN